MTCDIKDDMSMGDRHFKCSTSLGLAFREMASPSVYILVENVGFFPLETNSWNIVAFSKLGEDPLWVTECQGCM